MHGSNGTRLGVLCVVALLALVAPATAFTLEWFPVIETTSYDVERSVDAGAWTVVAQDVPCSGGLCSFTDPSPITKGCAMYRVVSKNAGGTQASATMAGECLPVPAPTVTPPILPPPPPPAVDAVEVTR